MNEKGLLGKKCAIFNQECERGATILTATGWTLARPRLSVAPIP
jgi:hypothetical protein